VNERDFDAIEEVATGQIASEARRWVGPFLDSFPEFRMEVVDVIAEGESSSATSNARERIRAGGVGTRRPVNASKGGR
jgi:hypothetical protein